MAKILDNQEIEFSKEDIEVAWQNSPKLINRNIDEFRMCFICKFWMEKANFNNGEFGWTIEFLNLKKFSLETKNFVAIHFNCRQFRPKEDCSKIFKKINALQWAFDEKNN